MKESPTKDNPIFVNGIPCQVCGKKNYKMWMVENKEKNTTNMVLQCISCNWKKIYRDIKVTITTLQELEEQSNGQ